MKNKGIPVLDVLALGSFYSDAFANYLDHSFRESGFIILVNSGFDFANLQKMYEKAAEVFNLSSGIKNFYYRPETMGEVGYLPFKSEMSVSSKEADLKEAFSFRRSGNILENVYPVEVPDFKKTVITHFAACDELAFEISEVLGNIINQKYLSATVSKGNNLLRVIHYPALKRNEMGQRSGEHEDINLFTILPNSRVTGLEVKLTIGGWAKVPYIPDSLILNVGDMLQMLTGGEYRSATHRVVNSSPSRLAAPMFVHPEGSFILGHRHGKPVTATEALNQRLQATILH